MYTGRPCLFAAAILAPLIAVAREEAQEPSRAGSNPKPKIEIMAGFAVGHPFRFDDRGFSNGVNFGAGVEVPAWRGLRFGAEINRTFGLSPSPAACGGISLGPGQPSLPCVGIAHYGVGAATAASFTAAYFFGHSRVQPYIVGGLSVLWTKQTSYSAIVRSDHIDRQEYTSSDTGVGPAFGFGLRASLTRHLSLRPELRFCDGTARSRANLSLLRLSAGIGYSW